MVKAILAWWLLFWSTGGSLFIETTVGRRMSTCLPGIFLGAHLAQVPLDSCLLIQEAWFEPATLIV